MKYIKRIEGRVCGPHNATELYFRNTHPTRPIRIGVDHHWVQDGQEIHKPLVFVLSPNPTSDPKPNDKDALMGCQIPGPTLQQFYWELESAEWG